MKEQTVTCEEVHEHICDNLDEDINSPNCRAIKLHLNECPECTSYLKSLKTTIDLYREYPSPRPSGSAKLSIDEIIRKGQSPESGK